MSIITISSIFNDDYNDYIDFCNNTVVADFIDTTSFETTLTTYVYNPIWLRYKDTPIKFSNDDKGKDAFLRNFYNQLSEVVFDFHNYAKENIEYFLYQNDVTKQGKPMSKTITSGIAPINQKIDQALDSTNLASGTGSQFVSETVYNGVAWHKLVEGYFTPNRKTALLKAFQWLFISVYSPETKYDDKIEQVRYVELSFVDDDNNIIDEQKVYPTKSYFTMSEVDIARPENLEPQNIKKGVDIAGVVGTLEPQIYPRIYDVLRLDSPDGEIVYNTPSGYDGIEGVTISIPSSAVAENIKYGVNIGGIIGSYTGDNTILNSLLDRSITTITTDATKLGDFALRSCKSLTQANFPSVTEIGVESFGYCDRLINANIPSVTTINASAFYGCSDLSEANFPLVTTLGQSAFYGCIDMTTINMPLITSVANNTFYNCSSLTNVSLPNITTINQSGFYGCSNLVTINVPLVNSIGNSGFYGCNSLTTNSFPNVTSISSYAFYNCFALPSINLPALTSATGSSTFMNNILLTTANLGNATSIGATCFNGCTSLTDLTLSKSSVCTLNNVNAFSGINNVITVHVPSNLISSYQTATNWSTLYNNSRVTFVGI